VGPPIFFFATRGTKGRRAVASPAVAGAALAVAAVVLVARAWSCSGPSGRAAMKEAILGSAGKQGTVARVTEVDAAPSAPRSSALLAPFRLRSTAADLTTAGPVGKMKHANCVRCLCLKQKVAARLTA
jgi:hypothetical protein